MSDQNFKNHAKFDPPFHFFLVPVLLGTFFISVKHAWDYQGGYNLWVVVFNAALVVGAFKTRIYSLKVQDRVIRLEERLRIEKLAPALADRFDELTPGQVVALRFASNGELASLLQKALEQKLPPKEIKAAITNWRPDHHRV